MKIPVTRVAWNNGTAHIELPTLPESIHVAMQDARGGNRVRSARFWEYVPKKRATRVLYANGAIGHCNCSKCNWLIDPYDAYCRRCGAQFDGTTMWEG